MDRRTFLQTAAAGALAWVSRATHNRPNIVYILADDLGWGDLKCCQDEGRSRRA